MKLSIVVPFYNELRTLPTLIERLLAVDFAAAGLETEIIFVDDGSSDAGRTLLDPPPRPDVRLIVHEHEKDPPDGRQCSEHCNTTSARKRCAQRSRTGQGQREESDGEGLEREKRCVSLAPNQVQASEFAEQGERA